MSNFVFIAVSLDGYIARPDGGLDWLETSAPPEDGDYGYGEFISGVDAVLMGRNTFEKVLSYGVWPYEKPVFVLSETLAEVPGRLRGRAEVVRGDPEVLVEELGGRGYADLYIDGGRTISGFLEADLIEEMTITTVPVLIGSGYRLFRSLPSDLTFTHRETVVYGNGLVKSRYARRRD